MTGGGSEVWALRRCISAELRATATANRTSPMEARGGSGHGALMDESDRLKCTGRLGARCPAVNRALLSLRSSCGLNARGA